MQVTSYDQWKGWSEAEFLRASARDRAYFEAELGILDLSGKNVLEVGFGNGAFLSWARSKGANIFGTEICSELTARAAANEITIVQADFGIISRDHKEHFDLIVAMDVLEHISLDQVGEFLDMAQCCLKSGGALLVRFPNGQSPFGRAYQYGDITHQSVLSAGIIGQLLLDRPLKIIMAARPATAFHGSIFRKMLQFFRQTLSRLIEASLARIYGFSCPLSPNVVLHIRKAVG